MSGMHRTLCFSSLGLCGSLALWHVLWRSRGCSQGERGRGPSNPGAALPSPSRRARGVQLKPYVQFAQPQNQ